MDLLASYDENSEGTPSAHHGEEGYTQSLNDQYELMMNSFSAKPSAAEAEGDSDDSDHSSHDHSSKSEDSSSDDEKPQPLDGQKSTDYSSDSSTSSSGSEKSKGSKVSKSSKSPLAAAVVRDASPERVRKVSSGTEQKIKSVEKSRSRSRSASKSKSRRHRRPRDHHQSSSSRHRHSRRERKSGRSRSRSGEKGHSRRHSSRDRKHRDGHRRRHRSRDDSRRSRHHHHGSGHHRRRSPAEPKRRSRSRSPVKRRSRSPLMGRNTFGGSTTARKPYFGPSGGRGRTEGQKLSWKEQYKSKFVEDVQKINAVSGGVAGPSTTQGPSTVIQSAGTNSAAAMGDLAASLAAQKDQQVVKTSQEIIQQQLHFQQLRTKEQVEAQVGVTIPTIYNPSHVTFEFGQKLKKQEEFKTKLKENKQQEEVPAKSIFHSKFILPGADDKTNEKFQRLMGGKKGAQKYKELSNNEEVKKEIEEEAERSQAIQQTLMYQYDQSRSQTHLNRGSGLGYSGTMYQPFG